MTLRQKQTWTRARRLAHSAVMVQRWAEGRYCQVPTRPDIWTARQNDWLRAKAGTMAVHDLAEGLNAQAWSLWPRSDWAVEVHLKILGLSTMAMLPTESDLQNMLGVGPVTIARWLRLGWLTGKRTTYRRGGHWLFSDIDIRKFLKNYRHCYDWRHIRDRRWRSEAEVLSRMDPLLSPAEAACVAGLSRRAFVALAERVGLPYLTRGGREHPRSWRLYRRSDVLNLIVRRAA